MTDHPCKGMTPAQRRDFELIATGQRPKGGYLTLRRLKARGLVEDAPPKILKSTRFGDIEIAQWQVPIPVHMQWCQWATEHAKPEAEVR